jgi:phosphodiesterase/alkaline phosphatase D-like protein
MTFAAKLFPVSVTSAAQYLWVGAVTETSITATVRADSAGQVVLVASTSRSFTTQHHSQPLVPVAYAVTSDGRLSRKLARGTITGLEPNTVYHLGVGVDGTIDANCLGRFKTPAVGPHSFAFGCASCANNDSNANSFAQIAARAEAGEIDFFQHMGDLHYRDIATNETWRFNNAYDLVFAQANQNAAWRSLPMYYTWDDHDFGPNDSHGAGVYRNAAVSSYRARVPSPPLAVASATGAVYYSYTRGRVRFIVTDLRSDSTHTSGSAGAAGRTKLGATQKAWFKKELTSARDAGQAICWVNSQPWNVRSEDNDDSWGSHLQEREEIAQFIATEGLAERMFAVSGDMHALAFVSAQTNTRGRFPIIHAGPLDKTSSHKLQSYTLGPFPGSTGSAVRQFGIVNVMDTGGSTIQVRFRGITVTGTTTSTTPIDTSFTLDIGAAAAPIDSPPALEPWAMSGGTQRITITSTPSVKAPTARGGTQKIIITE